MTTETTTKHPIATDEVLEDLRELLARALRTEASIAAQASAHLDELGDADDAQGEMGIALLTAWLADNVNAWTHTTRLREGLVKFDPLAASAALAIVLDNDDDEEGPQ